MKLSTKNIFLFFKIILPALICGLLFMIFKLDIGYHVLFFGLIIILFNLKKTKYNNLLSVVFSVIISYLAFFISLGLYFGIGYILMQFIELDKLEEVSIYGYNMKNLLMLLPISIFSPTLIFLLYKFLFKIDKSNYNRAIIWITIIILIVFGLVKKDFEGENASAFWQFIMTLALQLMLYQNELKASIRRKMS